jgi:glycosyltransferase involved in cell wall biosynthesis
MVVVAQLGARMHYAVPAILERSGILERMYTDICAPPLPRCVQKLAMRYGPRAIRRWFGRLPSDIPPEKIVSFPTMGLEYLRRQRSARSAADATAAHIWGGKEFCRRVIGHGLGGANIVYTFNSAGLELLECARQRGVRTVVEQCSSSTRIYEQLLRQEETEHPQWCAPHQEAACLAVFEDREEKEWQTADLILCGSEFVREGIRAMGGPVERCRVVPYGIREPNPIEPKAGKHEPLRVLVVGAAKLMKGSQYVLAAARVLKQKAEFRLAGRLEIPADAQKMLADQVTLLGAVPRSEIHRQYNWADVFLLPTLCEGSATVCYEALSHGLPVITTPNAGSVVRDGDDGFIVPIRDSSAITDRLERLADDGDLWAAMSARALARASEHTLERYGERLLSALRSAGSTPN